MKYVIRSAHRPIRIYTRRVFVTDPTEVGVTMSLLDCWRERRAERRRQRIWLAANEPPTKLDEWDRIDRPAPRPLSRLIDEQEEA